MVRSRNIEMNIISLVKLLSVDTSILFLIEQNK